MLVPRCHTSLLQFKIHECLQQRVWHVCTGQGRGHDLQGQCQGLTLLFRGPKWMDPAFAQGYCQLQFQNTNYLINHIAPYGTGIFRLRWPIIVLIAATLYRRLFWTCKLHDARMRKTDGCDARSFSAAGRCCRLVGRSNCRIWPTTISTDVRFYVLYFPSADVLWRRVETQIAGYAAPLVAAWTRTLILEMHETGKWPKVST